MRVAIVINTSWNIFNFRMGLIKAIQTEGHTVIAIAPKDEYSELLMQEGCEYFPVLMENSGTNPFKDFSLTYQLYKAYKKCQPDVVLHYTIKPNIYGALAANMLKLPAINNVSGLGTVFLKQGVTSRVARQMYRLSFRYPKMVFFQNDEDRQLFLDLKLVKSKITALLPGSGVNTQKFKPTARANHKHFQFLVISRLLIDKGIYEYIDAIKILKERGVTATFQLLGAPDPTHTRGIPLSDLESWQKNKLISYLGTTDNVLPYLQEADCVVLPSYREGTPKTLLEAASTGKPIVTTDVPGCRHVVKHGQNGYLCKVKDAKDLADKMENMLLLQDRERAEFGKNSREMAIEIFDERIVIDKYVKAIAKYANKNKYENN